MAAAEKWITLLTMVGVGMFIVFNAANVTTLANGLATNAVQYVGGIATVGRAT